MKNLICLAALLFCLGLTHNVSAQSNCLPLGTYTGSHIFNCNPHIGVAPCNQPCNNSCGLYTLTNSCSCCIAKIDLSRRSSSCFASCGQLDDPTHATWTGSSVCTHPSLTLVATSGNCLGTGKTLIIQLCTAGTLSGMVFDYTVHCDDGVTTYSGSFTIP